MSANKQVVYAMLGGFLGSGKTTMMVSLAKRLSEQGLRVGVITNDQAADLVDTGLARLADLPVSEIAGGCFCCRFQDLVKSCDEILDRADPDVLLAEPVGSCADLSATVMQPLKKFYGDRFRLVPYSVLCDPERAEVLLDGPGASSPAGYLFGKQLEEADLILLNKADRLGPTQLDTLLGTLRSRFPATKVLAISALTGDGVEAWWQQVTADPLAGRRILDIDYDTYADAEAALGWLNASIDLTAAAGFGVRSFCEQLLLAVRHGAQRAVAEIGHVKLLFSSSAGSLRGSVTSLRGVPEFSGSDPGEATNGSLTFNARVEMPPEDLERVFLRALQKIANESGVVPEVTRLQSFRPGRPTPTHRFETVVEPESGQA